LTTEKVAIVIIECFAN